jgi:hypothetical protein
MPGKIRSGENKIWVSKINIKSVKKAGYQQNMRLLLSQSPIAKDYNPIWYYFNLAPMR